MKINGYIFMLACRVASWKSTKQTLITTSTMKAKFVSVLRLLMTSHHYVILYVFLSQIGVHKETYAAKRAEKLKKMQKSKTCHDLVKT
jgi:hypothetical protein